MLTESTHKHPNIVTRRRWTTIYCRQQLLLKPLFQNDLGKVLATRPQPGVVREVPNEEISRKLRKQASRLKLRQFPLPLPTFFGGSPKCGPGIFGFGFLEGEPAAPRGLVPAQRGVERVRSRGMPERGAKNPEESGRIRKDRVGPGRMTKGGLVGGRRMASPRLPTTLRDETREWGKIAARRFPGNRSEARKMETHPLVGRV